MLGGGRGGFVLGSLGRCDGKLIIMGGKGWNLWDSC